jgi:hypothetical protein
MGSSTHHDPSDYDTFYSRAPRQHDSGTASPVSPVSPEALKARGKPASRRRLKANRCSTSQTVKFVQPGHVTAALSFVSNPKCLHFLRPQPFSSGDSGNSGLADGVLDMASSVYLLMDHEFCDPCFRFFNVLHEEGAPQTHGATVVQWCSVAYGFTGVNPMKLQDSCFISKDQQWPDANDAGMETKTAMICPSPSSPSSPSGFLQAPFRDHAGRTFPRLGKNRRIRTTEGGCAKRVVSHCFPIGLHRG